MLRYSEIKPAPKEDSIEEIIPEPVVVKAKAHMPVREESDEEECAAPSGRPEWPIGSAIISNSVM